MRTGLLIVPVVLAAASACAWDVEHDEIAQLTGEFLPDEIRRTLTFDDFATLLSNCHYPDMSEWPMENGRRRNHTLEELGEAVGAEDREIFRAQGYRADASWMHRERARATCLALMAKAFGAGDSHNAAFYLSVLTHSVSDESALNHPPLLHFVKYTRFADVDYGVRKVEEGAKNVFGFRSDGYVVHRAREILKGWRPETPTGDFAAVRDRLIARAVEEGHYAGVREGEIAFAPRPEAAEALAQLVAKQVRAILDYAWTAWTFRRGGWSLPDDGFDRRLAERMERTNDALDPATQGVFCGVFDEARNPRSPKGTVGVVCEPYGMFTITRLSYVGRILSAATARTLRDQGFAVRAIALRDLAKGLPPPTEMQTLFLDFGRAQLTEAQAAAVRSYLTSGGRLIALGGEDPRNLTGFGPHLRREADGDVPVSGKWGVRNVEETKRMALLWQGARIPLRRNPNVDGFCKPYAQNAIADDPSVTPLVRLENGHGLLTVAAKKGNVVWLSEYLLMPFVWSDDTTANWREMRLDSFGARLVQSLL